MTKVETAMSFLMQVFDTYAAGEGKTDTLTKAELKKLVQQEMPGMLKDAKNQEEVDNLMKSLDTNHDSEVDFNEFVVLVGALTCACHGLFPEHCTRK